MMLAVSAVHTTGVNWESVVIIVGSLASAFAVIQTFMFYVFNRRDTRREKEQTKRNAAHEEQANEVRMMIAEAMAKQTDALNHQTEILMSRLETKETVAEISVRLARVEGRYGIANSSGVTS